MGKRTNTAKWDEKRRHWKINVQKDGQRRSFYSSAVGRTGQREANAKADAWLDDNIETSGARIEKLYDEYIEELKLRTSQSHWRNEEYRGRVWIKPSIGKLKISKINEQHLQDIINKAYASGLSKKSLTDLRASLAAFFKYCRKRKVTTFLPEDIIIPRGAKVKAKTILQPEHIVTLFSIDTTVLYSKTVYDDLVNAYRFQVLTGLRPGELIGLQWSDVHNDYVSISRSINIYGDETTGKNENAIRTFILTDLQKAVLEDQRKRNPPEQDDFVFGEMTANKYRKRWEKYCAVNHLPRVTPYEIRHTFVSLVQGLPEAMVKTLVGHSKNMDTFGVYGHEVDGQKQAISMRLEEVFKSILRAT